MESIEESSSLGSTRRSWSGGSVPAGCDTSNLGIINWFNPRDGVIAREIYPNLPDEEQLDDKLPILEFNITMSNCIYDIESFY